MRKPAFEWLTAANDDLLTIREIIDKSYLAHIAAFHAQQCVEKALKALLEARESTVPKIHHTLKLGKMVGEDFDITESDEEMFDTLDQLYIESRYPGDTGLLPYGKPTEEDAEAFYRFAETFFGRVCRTLNISAEEFRHDA